MLKIRRSRDRLIFNMGIPILVRWRLYIETTPWYLHCVSKGDTTVFYLVIYIIQIKICAEYRDMLPRPRLVCQEPGLRPIGRSPGVPDKSSRGLGSMSQYSAQILICFIAYIFLIFFIPLWVWLGTLQDCQYAQCPLPLPIVIRIRLVIRQSKLPACLAEVQLAHQNTLWQLSHSLVKMTDKMDEICINGKFSAQEPSEWRDFSTPVSDFTVFQPRI